MGCTADSTDVTAVGCPATDVVALLAAAKPASGQELLNIALDEAVRITSSEFGYLYHYLAEEELFLNHAWSSSVTPHCTVDNPQFTYALSTTGCWGDVVRERRPVIINDYSCEHPAAKGLPDGHIPMHNWMSVPIAIEGEIRAVAGVANKAGGYTGHDVCQLTALGLAAWALADRIAAQQRLAFEREEARRATAAAASTHEAELRAQATLLHDWVSQPLAAANMHLGLVSATVRDQDPAVETTLETAVELVMQALRASRSVTEALSPQMLNDIGLAAALTQLALNRTKAGLPTRCDGPESVGEIDEAVAMFVYQAAVRLLDNVATHARASAAWLEWAIAEDTIALTVSDDGVGCDAGSDALRPLLAKGVSLLGIRERAEYLGGSLSIESAPGAGTVVRLSVPTGGRAERESG